MSLNEVPSFFCSAIFITWLSSSWPQNSHSTSSRMSMFQVARRRRKRNTGGEGVAPKSGTASSRVSSRRSLTRDRSNANLCSSFLHGQASPCSGQMKRNLSFIKGISLLAKTVEALPSKDLKKCFLKKSKQLLFPQACSFLGRGALKKQP